MRRKLNEYVFIGVLGRVHADALHRGAETTLSAPENVQSTPVRRAARTLRARSQIFELSIPYLKYSVYFYFFY